MFPLHGSDLLSALTGNVKDPYICPSSHPSINQSSIRPPVHLRCFPAVLLLVGTFPTRPLIGWFVFVSATQLKPDEGTPELPEGRVRVRLQTDRSIHDVTEDDIQKVRTHFLSSICCQSLTLPVTPPTPSLFAPPPLSSPQCNPCELDLCDDLSDLLSVNECGVLHTLISRAKANLSLTHAGPNLVNFWPPLPAHSKVSPDWSTPCFLLHCNSYLNVNHADCKCKYKNAPRTVSLFIIWKLFILINHLNSCIFFQTPKSRRGESAWDAPPALAALVKRVYVSMVGTRRDHSVCAVGRSGTGKTTACQAFALALLKQAGAAAGNISGEDFSL